MEEKWYVYLRRDGGNEDQEEDGGDEKQASDGTHEVMRELNRSAKKMNRFQILNLRKWEREVGDLRKW